MLKTKRSHLPALLLALAGGSLTARAQVAVTPVVVPVAGGFNYSYSVMDGAPFTLAIVNVPASKTSALFNLTAPAGFGISFDPGVGIVSFFEDNDQNTPQTFASGSTVNGFSFSSAVAPAVVTFDSLDENGNSYTGTTTSAAAPEPATFVSLGLGFGLAAFAAVRRRLTFRA